MAAKHQNNITEALQQNTSASCCCHYRTEPSTHTNRCIHRNQTKWAAFGYTRSSSWDSSCSSGLKVRHALVMICISARARSCSWRYKPWMCHRSLQSFTVMFQGRSFPWTCLSSSGVFLLSSVAGVCSVSVFQTWTSWLCRAWTLIRCTRWWASEPDCLVSVVGGPATDAQLHLHVSLQDLWTSRSSQTGPAVCLSSFHWLSWRGWC